MMITAVFLFNQDDSINYSKYLSGKNQALFAYNEWDWDSNWEEPRKDASGTPEPTDRQDDTEVHFPRKPDISARGPLGPCDFTT